MQSILDFAGQSNNHGNFVFACLAMFCISAFFTLRMFGNIFCRWVHQRGELRAMKVKHGQEMQILAEKRRIAEIQDDAVKLLIADRALADDFHHRLRVAMDDEYEEELIEVEVTPLAKEATLQA